MKSNRTVFTFLAVCVPEIAWLAGKASIFEITFMTMSEARITFILSVHKEPNTAFSTFSIIRTLLAVSVKFGTKSTRTICWLHIVALSASVASLKIVFTGDAIRHPETTSFAFTVAWQKIRKTRSASVSV